MVGSDYRTSDRVRESFEERVGRFLGLPGIPSPVSPASFDCRTARPAKEARPGVSPPAPVRGTLQALHGDDFFLPSSLQMTSLSGQASSPFRAKSLDGRNRNTFHRWIR